VPAGPTPGWLGGGSPLIGGPRWVPPVPATTGPENQTAASGGQYIQDPGCLRRRLRLSPPRNWPWAEFDCAWVRRPWSPACAGPLSGAADPPRLLGGLPHAPTTYNGWRINRQKIPPVLAGQKLEKEAGRGRPLRGPISESAAPDRALGPIGESPPQHQGALGPVSFLRLRRDAWRIHEVGPTSRIIRPCGSRCRNQAAALPHFPGGWAWGPGRNCRYPALIAPLRRQAGPSRTFPSACSPFHSETRPALGSGNRLDGHSGPHLLRPNVMIPQVRVP